MASMPARISGIVGSVSGGNDFNMFTTIVNSWLAMLSLLSVEIVQQLTPEPLVVQEDTAVVVASRRSSGDDGGLRDEAVADVIYRDPESLDCANAQETHVARLREDNFVGGLESFGGQDCITDVPSDRLLCGGEERAFAPWRDSDLGQYISWQPAQLRARIHQGFERRRHPLFVLRIAHYDADFEQTHKCKIGSSKGTSKQNGRAGGRS